MQAKESNGNGHSARAANLAAVREQLERILASPTFRNSKRHSAFLRFVVEETLGGAPQLKERSIGVQVFGLDPAYDTSANPIVRVSAGELRKRVAQYYHSPDHFGELRIDLPPGSYVPEFGPAVTETNLAVVEPAVEPEVLAPPAPRRTKWYAVAGLALVVAALLLWQPWAARDPFTRFWEPVWESPGVAVISVAARSIKEDTGRVLSDRMALNDAIGMSRLTAVLQAHGKDFRVLTRDTTTLNELQQGPAILIGAFSNELSMRLMREARFNFEFDPQTNLPGIRDRQNPTSQQWRVERRPGEVPQTSFTDYAIVSRVLDPATDRIAVVAAGVSARGTQAAAEFAASPSAMSAIPTAESSKWSGRNVQIVLAVPITPDRTGPTRVLAAYSW